MAKKTVKLLDLVTEIKGNKNISKNNIIKVMRALIKVIGDMLLEKQEVKFTSFVKLGFRITKDRLAKSSITHEILHIPQHLRFKATFYNEFKRFINKNIES